MSPEEICLVFRFKDESLKDFDRFIDNNFRYCSCFVALDDRSAACDNLEKVSRHPKCATLIRKNHQFTEMYGNCDREMLYAAAKTTGKKWVLALDIDEILDRRFAAELESLSDKKPCIWFPFYYMYPDESHYIVEGIYSGRFFPCLFRMNEDMCHATLPEGRIHASRVPDYSLRRGRMDKKWYHSAVRAASPIYHFSMCSEEQRRRRFDFYTRYDPGNKVQKEGYGHILAEHQNASILPDIVR